MLNKVGEHSMRSAVVSTAFAAAVALVPVAAGYAPALSQEEDFSITNQAPVATTPFRRDLMKQLQAWWNTHAFYPQHASNNDEAGIVTVHLQITADGSIWTVSLAQSSGSKALDTAGLAAFRNGIVQRFPSGQKDVDIDLSLHYVLVHQHDEKLKVSSESEPPNVPFTITNTAIKSPILETMLQRTCTGTVVLNGSLNRPWQGMHSAAEAIFFRKADGTPWVKFYERGYPSLSPVVQIGKMLQWVGRPEHLAGKGRIIWTTWTVWSDGANHLSGAEGSPIQNLSGPIVVTGMGGPIDLTCSTDILPTVPYSDAFAQTMVGPPGDPP